MLGLGFSLTKAATVLVSGEGGASLPASQTLSVRSTDDSLLDSFELWLGNSAGAVMAFCDGDSWANIKARPAAIAADYTAHPGIRKDWAIPLASNTQNVAATLAGTHDADITDLATAVLANDDHDHIWIRLGWEFNLTSYPWASGNATAADYILAYQRVVGLFRAVSDKFRFGWIPNWGGASNPEDWWPGDDYVDYVGMNMYFKTVFDQSTGQTGPEVWTNKLEATFGLNYIAAFADTHNKRLAIPEWGVDADEPAIVAGMAQFVSDNASNFLYHGYWDQDTPVVTKLSDNQFPLCSEAYIYHFGTQVEWTPAAYFGADLYDWFDTQDTETITMDGSNLVSNWESKVGSGRSAAQGDDGFKPVYEATARNGLPGINSDGVSDYLVQTSVSGVPAGQAAFTWAVQAYGDPSLATGFKYFLSETVENTFSTTSRALGSGSGNTRFQASGTLSTGQLHSLDRSIVCTADAGANQSMSLSVDGGTPATGTPAVGTFTVSRATLFAGGGSGGSFGGYSDVVLQEVIKINRLITSDETDKLHGYLAHRWGRESALPDTHPYKGNPPVMLESATQLLTSNDWTGVTILPVQGSDTGNLARYLRGGDFDTPLWATDDTLSWYELFVTGNGNPDPVSTYGGSSIKTVTGRDGSSVNALSHSIISMPPQTTVPQIRVTEYQLSGLSGVDGRTEPVFYQRMWIKFDPDTLARAQRVGSGAFYQILWEAKCEPDFRLRVQLQYNGTKLYWVAHDDVLTDANPIHIGSNTTVDVVLASQASSLGWHKVEVYVDRANGIWRAAVDGSDIINLNLGAGTDLFGVSGNIMNFPMFTQVYGDSQFPFSGDGPMEHLWENIELWDSPPLDAWT